MLDFRIQNESLDLPSGAQLEVEENNPLLQLSEEIAGQYSLPLDLPATPKNIRLTKQASLFQSRPKATIEASLFETGFQHSLGKLRFEKLPLNLNDGQSSTMSCYYLTGISSFWQDVKGKRLRDVNLGGVQNFGWDNYAETGNGFWGHITTVMRSAPGTYDYCFYEAEIEETSYEKANVRVVNTIFSRNNGGPFFSPTSWGFSEANFIVPFIFLTRVLYKAVALAGWTLRGNVLNDAQFQLITLENARAIDWAFYRKNISQFGGPYPRPQVSYNLADHLPDVSVAELLLALRNRFGWWFDIDRAARVITIKELRTAVRSNIKNVTAKASPVVTKTVLQESRVWGLKNTSGSGPVSFEGLTLDAPVNDPASLPAPGEGLYNHVRLVKMENNFYVVGYNDDSKKWEWQFYAANTGDVIPTGTTEEVTGTSTVCDQVRNPFSEPFFLPHVNSSGFWPGRNDDLQSNEIQFCFYYGLRLDVSGRMHPFASHHIFDNRVAVVGTWSLALTGLNVAGQDVGLFARNWKAFLERLTAEEEIEITLYLARHEFMAMRWEDELTIAGVQLYAKSRKYTLPYKGFVTLNCLRVRP